MRVTAWWLVVGIVTTSTTLLAQSEQLEIVWKK